MKAIKDFFNRYKIISILGIVTIAICVSYCITYRMPDYFGIEAWYSLLNNISISYIAALIFFIFQVHIPLINGEQNAIEAIRPDMNDLEKMLSLTRVCLSHYVRYRDNGGADLKWDETSPQKMIYFKYGDSRGKLSSLKSLSEFEIKCISSLYLKKLSNIKNSVYAKYFSEELIGLLNDMEKTKAFENVTITLAFAGSFLNMKSMEKDEASEQLINRIRAMFSIKTDWAIGKLDEFEKVAADAPRNIGQYKSVDEMNANALEKYIRKTLSPQLKEKNVTLSEENWKKIIDTIVESRIEQR